VLGGTLGGEPLDPYASSAGMCNLTRPPLGTVSIRSSHPLMTLPVPTVNVKA